MFNVLASFYQEYYKMTLWDKTIANVHCTYLDIVVLRVSDSKFIYLKEHKDH